MSQTLGETIKLALSGCVHEFHVADLMACDRFDVLTCRQCGVDAMAGEVAWMLAGGQIVRINYECESERQRQLDALANMPVEGGVQ